MSRIPLLCAALALTGLLAGCSTSAPPPRAAQSLPPAGAVARGSADLGPELNAFRRANSRGPLSADPALAGAARDHARYLAQSGRFSHTGRGGSDLSDRIAAAGVRACLAAENLSGGRTAAAQVIEGWARSRGHRRNMLLGDVTHFGAARAGDIWVLVLARRC